MEELVKQVFDTCSKYQPDFVDVRILKQFETSIRVQDGRVDRVFGSELSGAGIRVLVEGAWGFASTNEVTKDSITRAAEDAAKMANALKLHVKERIKLAEVKPAEAKVKAVVKIDPRDIPEDEKAKDIAEFEALARKFDPRVVNTVVDYTDTYDLNVVANTLGTYVENETIRTFVSTFVVAKEGANRQSAFEARGRLEGYELIKGLRPEEFSVKVAERAVSLLAAKPPPAGKFTTILDPAVVGVLVHEAFGHNSEADLVLSGASIIANMVGQEVASPLVTIVDDSTVEGAYGSYVYDSEGVPSQRRTIVEKGILKGYLHSLETAARLNASPTGSARSIEHVHRPLVRMSNTYVEPGDWKFEEMVEGVKEGIYLKGAYWGYVFTERGQFTCNVEEGYMIRNGELEEHITNVSFGGLTLETLRKVNAVGRDFELKLPGFCGKDGQLMYVDGGGPHIRVKDVVVGGRRL